jgi:hypothetical protein
VKDHTELTFAIFSRIRVDNASYCTCLLGRFNFQASEITTIANERDLACHVDAYANMITWQVELSSLMHNAMQKLTTIPSLPLSLSRLKSSMVPDYKHRIDLSVI